MEDLWVREGLEDGALERAGEEGVLVWSVEAADEAVEAFCFGVEEVGEGEGRGEEGVRARDGEGEGGVDGGI